MNSAFKLLIKVATPSLVCALTFLLWPLLNHSGGITPFVVLHGVSGVLCGTIFGLQSFVAGPIVYLGVWSFLKHSGGDGDIFFLIALFGVSTFSVGTLLGSAFRWGVAKCGELLAKNL